LLSKEASLGFDGVRVAASALLQFDRCAFSLRYLSAAERAFVL
jgi:hypothetical protein